MSTGKLPPPANLPRPPRLRADELPRWFAPPAGRIIVILIVLMTVAFFAGYLTSGVCK